MVEIDGTVCYGFDRTFRIDNVRLFRQNLRDTIHGCFRHGQHNEDHGQHHQTHKNIHDIIEHTHQFTGSHGLGNNHPGTKPGNSHNTSVHRHLHNGHVGTDDLFRFHGKKTKLRTCLFHLRNLMILTHIRLHHPDSINIFLNTGIQIIVFFEHPRKYGKCCTHNNYQCRSENDNSHQKYTG